MPLPNLKNWLIPEGYPVMIISTSFYVNTLAQHYQFARDSNHFTQICCLETFITGQFPLYHHLHLLPIRLLGYAVKNPEGFFPIKFACDPRNINHDMSDPEYIWDGSKEKKKRNSHSQHDNPKIWLCPPKSSKSTTLR